MQNLKEIIYKLETELLKPEVRISSQKLDELLAPEFVEYGSSGLIYNKKDILERLPAETPPTFTVYDFEIVSLSEDIVQTRFKTEKTNQDGSKTTSLRNSIWKNYNGKWQIIFHQGTVAK